MFSQTKAKKRSDWKSYQRMAEKVYEKDLKTVYGVTAEAAVCRCSSK